MTVLGSYPSDLNTIHDMYLYLNELRHRQPWDMKHPHYFHSRKMQEFESFYMDFRKRVNMSKKTSNKQAFKWQGYVNVNLTVDAMNEVERILKNTDQIWNWYIQALNTDYKFGSQWNEKQQAYISTLTCHNVDSPDYGYVLSAFAGHPFDSMGVLLYKHFVFTEQDWTSFKNEPQRKFG